MQREPGHGCDLADDRRHLDAAPGLDSRDHLEQRAREAPAVSLGRDSSKLLGVERLGRHVVESALCGTERL
eukprot:2041673-Rhodomonas_salina.1